jgi:hypothetical protein
VYNSEQEQILTIVSSAAEFWKQISPREPYRIVLGDVRDKLYNTCERARQILSHGVSNIPEDKTFVNVKQVCRFHIRVSASMELKKICCQAHLR